MIRNLIFADLKALGEIPWDYPALDLSSGLYCSQKALIHQGKLVGGAFLKLTSEAILILDPKENEITRASLIREAMEELEPEARGKFGLDEVHVFAPDQHFSEVLKKHFHFQDVKGIPLVWKKNGS